MYRTRYFCGSRVSARVSSPVDRPRPRRRRPRGDARDRRRGPRGVSPPRGAVRSRATSSTASRRSRSASSRSARITRGEARHSSGVPSRVPSRSWAARGEGGERELVEAGERVQVRDARVPRTGRSAAGRVAATRGRNRGEGGGVNESGVGSSARGGAGALLHAANPRAAREVAREESRTSAAARRRFERDERVGNARPDAGRTLRRPVSRMSLVRSSMVSLSRRRRRASLGPSGALARLVSAVVARHLGA